MKHSTRPACLVGWPCASNSLIMILQNEIKQHSGVENINREKKIKKKDWRMVK